ncbi:MAG: hypothetical protein ABWY06_01865 [Pseudomonas sp.]|uniref:hypothetical protein n=1 Tax=Pseudomonas sp. TaxID=306 RepID=UPI00339A5274
MSESTLRTLAALLRRGQELDRLSTALTLLALALGLALPWLTSPSLPLLALFLGLVLLGLAQKYWALRVAFDADLLQQLAAAPGSLEQRTDDLDNALVALGLLPTTRTARPWAQRIQGALRLLRTQALLCALQLLLALTGVLMPFFYALPA